MNIIQLDPEPEWDGVWSVDEIMSTPEYPDIGAFPSFFVDPHPAMAIVRLAEEAMLVYTLRYIPLPEFWFIPMIQRRDYPDGERKYRGEIGERHGLVLHSFKDAVDVAAGLLMRGAL